MLTVYNNSSKLLDINSKPTTLTYYANLYYQTIVSGSSPATEKAKKNDISKFLSFFIEYTGNDHVDNWTPSTSRYFLKELLNKDFKPNTINRVLDSLKHFAKWLDSHRPLLAGYPFIGIKNIYEDPPHWNGLSSKQVMRLKMACEQRLKACERKNQNPLMEITIFLILLNTGLRESELVSLNIQQYYARGFHNVRRKGSNVTKKIPVPDEAKQYLDRYLETLEQKNDQDPIFNIKGKRISTRAVRYVCQRISAYASSNLAIEEKIHLSPHMLRHTFLKKIADKHGIHIAQKMSGNVSISEIFRYTKPSQDEIDQIAEELNP